MTREPHEPAPADPAAVLGDEAEQRFLRALLRRMGLDEHAIDDAVQETWLAALRHSGAAVAARRAWLGTIARNAALQVGRGSARRRRREREVARPEAQSAPAPDGDRDASVTAALATLDARYQEVLRARYHDDLPPTRIADRLGIPVETVRTRLKRGIAALHAAWLAEVARGRRRRE